jgi:hypothetical protein
MDFADFDLQSASEAGTWLHLDLDGPLYRQADDTIGHNVTDWPCRVQLRGMVSSGVLDLIRHVERLEIAHQARMSRAKDSDIDRLVRAHQSATFDAMERLIVAAVAGWENIIENGKPIEPTPDAVLRILGPQRVFFEQVYQAILDRRRFLKSAAKA